MPLKFNFYERMAGLFVLTAIVVALGLTVGVAIQRGWLESYTMFVTTLDDAQGIHPGTAVEMAGLRAGSVQEVRLRDDKKIDVVFSMANRYRSRVREDSVVQVLRPFVIGEKLLDVSVGDPELTELKAGDHVALKPSVDVLDLLGGKRLGPLLATMEGVLANLKVLVDAFSDPKRSAELIDVFDGLSPLVMNLNQLTRSLNSLLKNVRHDKKLDQLVLNLAEVSADLARAMPTIREKAPQLGDQLPQLISSITLLANEFQKLAPAIAEIAPEMPQASRRALELLDETVVVLKALQKNYFLRDRVEEVRTEERMPASSRRGQKPRKE